MSDSKDVHIEIDAASWTVAGKTVPSQLTGIHTPRKMSVGVALLHTALRTRPPHSTGMSLSDYWAWLRYGPAISDSSDLRLRSEWQDIDPHQKTVLSDDLGMGFTTYLLARVLKFKSFADTLHFVNVANPGNYKFLHVSKNGKYKAPDFVAFDSAGSSSSVNVVECKGTQSSRKALLKAVGGGIPQKRNLETIGGSSINHALVAGLFIPAHNSKETALIHISDPDHRELVNVLASIALTRVQTAIIQIDLAQHFALMGLYSIANALASTDTSQVDSSELNLLHPSDDRISRQFEIAFPLPAAASTFGKERIRRVRFSMACPARIYNDLVESSSLEDALSKLVATANSNEWEEKSGESEVTLVTPLGFRLSLAYLSQ